MEGRNMSAEKNIIQKSTIQFKYPSRDLAIRCNELIEKIFATHILPEMDEALGLKSINGINLELASVEIDIGKIKEQDLERYLGERIKEALALKLSNVLNDKMIKKDYGNKIKIDNSGLVLIWPFLTMLFTRLGMIEGNRFKDETSQNRAVYLLQYLAFGDVDFPEYELELNKILVGMPLATHLEPGIVLTEEEKNLCDSLLKGILQNWEKLKTSTVEALQVTFLQRLGELSLEKNMISLKVEPKGVDALMESISWNIKMVKLPWIDKAIQINWR